MLRQKSYHTDVMICRENKKRAVTKAGSFFALTFDLDQ